MFEDESEHRMKRTPMKRKTPLRSKSPKTAVRDRKRVKFRAEQLMARPRCEAKASIWTAEPTHPCTVQATDLHEPLTRARGGSVLDPGNTVAVCRPCHQWIHAHPTKATGLGLLRRAGGH